MTFPVKAVIFDWAGTMIDFGCMAPVNALLDVFDRESVPITPAEARADMGRAKMDHLRAILAATSVAQRWHAAKGASPDETDLARLYALLEPAMTEATGRAAHLIPGALSAFEELTALGVRIGSGTGYTRAMMSPILLAAAAQGYRPEVVICAGETPSGRPAPLMTWAALVALNVWPAWCCIKVDDAAVGIIEGREAGCWTIGVAASGNGVGLDEADFAALSHDQRRELIAAAAAPLVAAGADFVVDDVSQLLPVVQAIAARIERGERPNFGCYPQ